MLHLEPKKEFLFTGLSTFRFASEERQSMISGFVLNTVLEPLGGWRQMEVSLYLNLKEAEQLKAAIEEGIEAMKVAQAEESGNEPDATEAGKVLKCADYNAKLRD